MIDDDQKYLRLIYRVCQNGYRFKIAITQCTNIVFCAAKSNFEEDQYCGVGVICNLKQKIILLEQVFMDIINCGKFRIDFDMTQKPKQVVISAIKKSNLCFNTCKI